MGRLHKRPARHFVDGHVKNDSKLLKWIKHHPIIYDKSHTCHRNRAEREKTWEFIAKKLHKPAHLCKARWYELLKEYRDNGTILTLHDIILDQLDNCFNNSPKVPPNPAIEEIEDDVLSQLFSESIEQEIERPDPEMSLPSISIEATPQETSLDVEQLPDLSGLQCSFYADSGIGLMDEACSLPPSEIPFNFPQFLIDDIPPLEDILYSEDQNIDDYYYYFVESILDELNKYPFLFGDIIDSLMEGLDEETSTETRKEIVKMLCQRLKHYHYQSRE